MNRIEFKRYREQVELTQETLAELFGVSHDTVQRWERGKTPIPLLAKFAIHELAANPAKTTATLSRPELRY